MAQPGRRKELLDAIAQEEARVARLESEQADARSRLAALRAELASFGAEPELRERLAVVAEVTVPNTSAEKVKLFRSLFRGREEVFPTRFVSKKTGKAGYAPACRNKFVKGVCELPKVKCGECPNQAFIAFDAAAVVGHLSGRHVMVVYPLLDQWRAQLSLFLGIEPKEIGQIGAGKKSGNGRLDVAMIQSLVRKEKVEDVVANYGQVIVDECHHLPAVSFERVLAEAKARYVVGLTATPQRRDGHHPITGMQLGPVRFAIDPKSQAAQRPFAHKLLVRETGFNASSEGTPGIQELYAALAADEKRNRLILDDVIQALEQGASPILLTERKDHLEYFADQLIKFTRHLVVLQGGMSAKERRGARERLAAIPNREERLVLATGRCIGEGFDDARLDTLFLALPVSWKGTLIQYTGRLHRLHPGKAEVRIFDYVDRGVPILLRMFEKRLRGYRAIGYARGEAPLGYAESGDEVTVEHDEDVLRSLKDVDEFA